MAKATYDYDLIVIGSGAAGSVAAHTVAAAGKRVALIEAGIYGGECLNWGDVPSKALLEVAHLYDASKHAGDFGLRGAAIGYNYPSIKAWKERVVQRSGVAGFERQTAAEGITTIHGQAHFISPREITVNRRHLSSEYFLIATGSTTALPSIEGLDKAGFLTNRDIFGLTRPPKSLFVIGAGRSGCETAELFAIFGSKIYLSDIESRALPHEDTEVSTVIEDIFAHDRGMELLPSTKVLSIKKEGVLKQVTFQRGAKVDTVKVEDVLVTTGKVPALDLGLENAAVSYQPQGIVINEHLQTSARHIYAAGDVIGPYRYTHTAIYQARLAAHNMLHRDKRQANYAAVPRVTYLTPEIASVGMTEAECLRRDLPIRKGLAPLGIIGRATIAGQQDGFVKVLGLKDGTILGATIVSPHAGEMIHELTLAIQYGLRASEVAAAIHAFPSWSEAVRVACAKL